MNLSFLFRSDNRSRFGSEFCSQGFSTGEAVASRITPHKWENFETKSVSCVSVLASECVQGGKSSLKTSLEKRTWIVDSLEVSDQLRNSLEFTTEVVQV